MSSPSGVAPSPAPAALSQPPAGAPRPWWRRLLDLLSMPLLATVTAFVLGSLVIWLTSGSLLSVWEAYDGLLRGAFFKERGFSETLVATVPYILLSLGVAVGFKAGLFNIGVEGQFYVGAICAAWIGQAFQSMPALVDLPLTLLAGAVGGALWAAVPGYLKARTGAHEVITSIMMNYIAFRLAEYVVSGPLRDPGATAVQTPRVASGAELWTFSAIPQRLQDPLNAFGTAVVVALAALLVARWLLRRSPVRARSGAATPANRGLVYAAVGVGVGLIAFFGLPALTSIWWPFPDQYDRLHIGLVMALAAAVAIWWLLYKTTIGFELRTVGANPNAARYAGMNITRNIMVAMAISGALAGLAGTVEILGVSICRCLPLFFSSGYGFDSIAIALLGKNHPFGIVVASLLFGAMRNGQDLMELNSGVSKYIISLLQALVLLFVAAPAIVRWIYRIKGERRPEDEGPVMRGGEAEAMSTATKTLGSERQVSLRGAWWVTWLFAAFGLLAAWWLLNLVIGGKCDGACVVGTLGQALRVATPIALAAFCGVMCERAGVVDIGIDGKMLTAAMVAYATNLFAYQALKDSMGSAAAGDTSRWLAVLGALIGALLMQALHAVVSIRFKVNQIISGTVINILALGVTGYMYRQFLAENLPAGPGTFPISPIPGLAQIPIIGPIVFQQKPLTYVMLLLAVAIHYMLFATRWGLRTRAVGEHPRAADTLGIDVIRTRYVNVLVGGLIAGLGGAWFTLEAVDVFSPMMTNGLGFIGLAAMIFGKWTPFGALVGAMIFGLGNSVTSTISIFRPDIPSQIPQMLPYLLTIIVLAGVVGRAVPPAADGEPYEKGQ